MVAHLAEHARDIEAAQVCAEQQAAALRRCQTPDDLGILAVEVEPLRQPCQQHAAVEQRDGEIVVMAEHVAPGRTPPEHLLEILTRGAYAGMPKQHEVQAHRIEQGAARRAPEHGGETHNQLHAQHRTALALGRPMPAHK